MKEFLNRFVRTRTVGYFIVPHNRDTRLASRLAGKSWEESPQRHMRNGSSKFTHAFLWDFWALEFDNVHSSVPAAVRKARLKNDVFQPYTCNVKIATAKLIHLWYCKIYNWNQSIITPIHNFNITSYWEISNIYSSSIFNSRPERTLIGDQYFRP